jgi:type VI secretion system protein ImpM
MPDPTARDVDKAAGWYGKLPSLGDFASRRLPPDFIDAWDAWIARGLADWKQAAPRTWVDEYLAAPSWRFVLLPGALPGRAGGIPWAGVLMPSVDRVGRYFPLTVAHPLVPLPSDGGTTEWLLRWLQRLDDAALDALNDDWSVGQLESALAASGAWPPEDDPANGPIAGIDLHSQPSNASLWFIAGADGRTRMHVEDGLPAGPAFRALLTGAYVRADEPFPLPTINAHANFYDY